MLQVPPSYCTLLNVLFHMNLACYRLIRALATAATWIFLATNLRTFQSNKTGGRNTLWFFGGTRWYQYRPNVVCSNCHIWKLLP